MIHVFCSRWGVKYPIEYVNNLNSMLQRNMRTKFKLYCQTDDTMGMHRNIEALPFLEDLPESTPKQMWDSADHRNGLPRLWDRPKLNYYKPGGWGIKGQKMSFDLDMIIQRDLTPLIEMHQDKILFGRSWWHNMNNEKKPFWKKCHAAKINGGFSMWNDKQSRPLWNDLKKNWKKIYYIYTGGSDNWITERHFDRLDLIPSKYYYSFNNGCEWPHDMKKWQERPEKIVCAFNCNVGDPLQYELHEAIEGFPWVRKYWW